MTRAFRTAIYYPHTHIHSASLLRTALLTWDRVECLVPWDRFRPQVNGREQAEALELIAQYRSLHDVDRDELHTRVAELLDHGPIRTLTYAGPVRHSYAMWSRKLNWQTWQLLERSGRASFDASAGHHNVDGGIALTIMAMMADIAGGETRTRITDEHAAYKTIADFPTAWDHKPPDMDAEYVVGLTFKAVNLNRVPLSRLISMRRAEEREGGHALRDMRHALMDAIDDHVRVLTAKPLRETDRAELDRIFEQKMESDYRELKSALGFPLRQAFLSKDVMTFAIATGAAAASLLTSGQSTPELALGLGAPP